MQAAVFDRTLINELNQMMQELYDLVSQLQTPKPGFDNWKQAIRDRCEELVARITEFLNIIRQKIDVYEDNLAEDLIICAKTGNKHGMKDEILCTGPLLKYLRD